MTLDDLFNSKPLKLDNLTCHSGGAIGADTLWEEIGEEFGVKTRAYSYKTKSHTTPNKVEMSDDDYNEYVFFQIVEVLLRVSSNLHCNQKFLRAMFVSSNFLIDQR